MAVARLAALLGGLGALARSVTTPEAVAPTAGSSSACAAAEAKLCRASKHGGTQPTDCEVCVALHISELASAGCTDADIKQFCDPTLSFGGDKLHFELDRTFSIKAITTSKGGGKIPRSLLLATTPMWQVTTTDCSTVFPEGQPVTSQFTSDDVRRTMYMTELPDNYTVHFRWEHVDIGSVAPGTIGNASQQLSVEVRMTLASPATAADLPGIASFTGSVKSPAGVCVQSFSLLDLRGLSWNPERGDRMFIPTAMGSVSDCGRHDPGPCSQWLPGGTPGGSASFPEIVDPLSPSVRAQQLWAPSGDSNTMGWRALTLAPVPGDASSVQMSLYLAAHDPVGRLKMMPSTAALTLAASQQTQGALLRVVSVPDSLLNSNPSNFSLPHPVVLATTTGDWWDASQIYRDWALSQGNAAWTASGPLHAQVARGDLPQWAVTVPFWTRANGNCEYPQASTGLKCAEKMRQLKALLGGIPLAMHWYGWNAEPFDSKYPHYTVLPGVEKEVASLQAAGVHVFPYTNGRLFDPSLPEFTTENAEDYACGCFNASLTPQANGMKPTDGCDANGAPGYYREGISSGSFLAVMDPSTPFYQRKLANVSAQVVAAVGNEGLYLDELGTSHALRCFEGASSNGGGGAGSGWATGTRKMLRMVRNATKAALASSSRRGGGSGDRGQFRHPAVPIISEAMNEQYLGLVPLNLAIYNHEFTSHCTSVPAYQAVYGGWAINVGDNRFPWSSRAHRMQNNWVEQQRVFLAQSFVEGSAMGWMALEELAMWMNNATHAADIAFVRRLCELRMAADKFLVHGRLWRPPVVRALMSSGAPIPTTLTCDFGTFGSTAAINPALCCNVSNALVHTWTSQNATELAAVAVNHGMLPLTVEADVTLPSALLSVKDLVGRSMGGGAAVATTVPTTRSSDGKSVRLVLKLPPRSAAVFDLVASP